MGKILLVIAALLVLVAGAQAQQSAERERNWGLGWDDGLTVRRWLGSWELSLAAGPDDYLVKEEFWEWDSLDPEQVQGRLELPLDEREEHGWVRLRGGYGVIEQGPLQVTAFTGVTYEWIDHQERALELDSLVGDYDTFELDRFTDYWILEAGLRPSWRLHQRLTCEFSFGLRYVWADWDQTVERNWAGLETTDRSQTEGSGNSFQDFGWEGVASLGFLLWL